MTLISDAYKLVFVRDVSKIGDIYEYDFYFSKNPDIFWGYGFDCDFADQIDVEPDENTYDEVLRLRTVIPLFCMQHNKCFSMTHVINGVLCVAFEDLADYDEYPEPYRLVFHYGEDYSSVEAKLADRHQLFSDD